MYQYFTLFGDCLFLGQQQNFFLKIFMKFTYKVCFSLIKYVFETSKQYLPKWKWRSFLVHLADTAQKVEEDSYIHTCYTRLTHQSSQNCWKLSPYILVNVTNEKLLLLLRLLHLDDNDDIVYSLSLTLISNRSQTEDVQENPVMKVG